MLSFLSSFFRFFLFCQVSHRAPFSGGIASNEYTKGPEGRGCFQSKSDNQKANDDSVMEAKEAISVLGYTVIPLYDKNLQLRNGELKCALIFVMQPFFFPPFSPQRRSVLVPSLSLMSPAFICGQAGKVAPIQDSHW